MPKNPFDDEIKETEQRIALLEIDMETLEEDMRNLEIRLLEENGVLKYLTKKQQSYHSSNNTEVVSEHQSIGEIPQTDDGVIDLSKLMPSNNRKQSLLKDVWEVISKFGDQEFDSPIVFEVLKAKGITIEGKYPKSRVSTVLSKLEDQKKITKTFEGGGNIPNKYCLAKEETATVTENDDGCDLVQPNTPTEGD